MDLTLTNYQSWEDARIKVEGVTCVWGPSNLGKSAFGRAIRGALRNEILPEHIRLGSDGVRVEFAFDNHRILATRGAKAKDSVVYNVDGADYSKLAGGVPDSLAAMNFGTVCVNGVTIDPIFAGQFDSQFLLGSSPAELNAVLNAFASTEKLDAGRKILASRVNEVNASAKALSPRISAELAQVADLDARLSATEELQKSIEAMKTEALRLTQAKVALNALVMATHYREAVLDQLQALETLSITLSRATGLTICATAASTAQGSRVALRVLRGKIGSLGTLGTHLRASVATYSLCHHSRAARVALQTSLGIAADLKVIESLRKPIAAVDKAYGVYHTYGRYCIAKTKLALAKAHNDLLQDVLQATWEPLKIYKAVVRLKAIRLADPAPLRAKAASIHDLSPLFSTPNTLLQAAIITHGLVGTCLPKIEDTAAKLAEVDQNLQSIGLLKDEAEHTLEHLRSSAVSCPKCGHEFLPTAV